MNDTQQTITTSDQEIATKTQGNLAVPPPSGADAYDAFADEGGHFGKLLKFVKGKYTVNDKAVDIGTEYVALVPEMQRGWVRFEEGRPVEHRLGLIREGFQFAPRASLGFNDQRKWERDKRKAEQKDPWQKQVYLPLLRLESDDEVICFVSGSVGGQQALRDLVRAYKPKAATSELPIISLQSDTYEHDNYGTVSIPILRVEGWHDAGTVPPPPARAPAPIAAPAQIQAPAKAVGKDEADNSDMGDEDIPF